MMGSTGLAVEMLFCGFIGAQEPRVEPAERLAYSAAAVLACGACAWSFATAAAAWAARDHDHTRRQESPTYYR